VRLCKLTIKFSVYMTFLLVSLSGAKNTRSQDSINQATVKTKRDLIAHRTGIVKGYRSRGDLVVLTSDSISPSQIDGRLGNKKSQLKYRKGQLSRYQINEDSVNINEELKRIQAIPGVLAVDFNHIYESEEHESLKDYGYAQKHLQNFTKSRKRKLKEKQNRRSQTIRIGIMDSGIDTLFAGSVSVQNGYNALNELANDFADSSIMDYYGHGTKIAGVINETIEAIVERDQSIEIVPVKVMDYLGYADLSSVADGLQWLIKENPSIIVMAFSSNNNSPILEKLISKARKKGILILAAAGNDGRAIDKWPASYEGVISVGSIDDSRRVSEFSNYGKNVDIFAFGEMWRTLQSSCCGNGLAMFSGTSAAVAYVTGVLASLATEKENMKIGFDALMSGLVPTTIHEQPEVGEISVLDENALIATHFNLEGYAAINSFTQLKISENDFLAEIKLTNLGVSPLNTQDVSYKVSQGAYSKLCKIGSIPYLYPKKQFEEKWLISIDDCIEIALSDSLFTSIEYFIGDSIIGSTRIRPKAVKSIDASIGRVTLVENGSVPYKNSHELQIVIRNESFLPLENIEIDASIQDGVGEAIVNATSHVILNESYKVEPLMPNEARILKIPVNINFPLTKNFTISVRAINSIDRVILAGRSRGVIRDNSNRFVRNYDFAQHRDVVARAIRLLDSKGLLPPDLMGFGIDYVGSSYPSSTFHSQDGFDCRDLQGTNECVLYVLGEYLTLLHGANDEDIKDIVYKYTLDDAFDSHFWLVDRGDDNGLNSLGKNHHSALTKIKAFLNGGGYLEDGAFAKYLLGDKGYSYYYLGHALHLLSDMTLAAHTLDDNWHGLPNQGDAYEIWMKIYAAYLGLSDELIKQKGLVDPYHPENSGDPVRFLTYTAAQVGSYFPRAETVGTDAVNGNSISGGDYPHYQSYMDSIFATFPNRPIIAEHLNTYEVIDGSECQHVKWVDHIPFFEEKHSDCNHDGILDWDNTANTDTPSDKDGDLSRIRNNAYTYAVRACAGLIYYFAKETGQYYNSHGSSTALLLL